MKRKTAIRCVASKISKAICVYNINGLNSNFFFVATLPSPLTGGLLLG